MLDNLGWMEIVTLLLIALFVIGPERLPKLLGEMGKGVRKLRRMASNATADISREVGTDIDITDLHPKKFIRKHVLSEEDEEALKNPLKNAFNDVKNSTTGLRKELDDTASAIKSNPVKPRSGSESESADESTDTPPAKQSRTFDADAT